MALPISPNLAKSLTASDAINVGDTVRCTEHGPIDNPKVLGKVIDLELVYPSDPYSLRDHKPVTLFAIQFPPDDFAIILTRDQIEKAEPTSGIWKDIFNHVGRATGKELVSLGAGRLSGKSITKAWLDEYATMPKEFFEPKPKSEPTKATPELTAYKSAVSKILYDDFDSVDDFISSMPLKF